MTHNYTAQRIACLLLLVAGILQIAVGETLADSGYPMRGANPQRNYQSNRKLLCSQVAGEGRSQVLQSKWTFPTENFLGPTIVGTEVTVDASGNVYAGYNADGANYFMKFNGPDGRILGNLTFPPLTTFSYPTHVAGGKFYFYTAAKSYIVDAATMTFVGDPIDHSGLPPDTELELSYAPYKGTHMVAANTVVTVDSVAEALTYIKVADKTLDQTQFNFEDGNPKAVLIYKDATYEFPIVTSVVGNYPGPYTTQVISPRYTFNTTDVLARAWIEGSTLHFYTFENTALNTLHFYQLNAVTGALLSQKTVDTFEGSPFTLFDRVFVVNNISVAQVTDGNSKTRVVDLINNRRLFGEQEKQFHDAAMFSKPDNTMLMQVGPLFQRIELVGLEWDTLEVNTRGLYPSDNIFSDIIIGPPVIGEDCHVFTTLNARLFAFAPLPIQDVVPIFECVNEDGVVYFSYNNLEDIGFAIPQLLDRNNLAPLNITPGVDFEADRRGKYFPLSFRVNFGTTGTFTWQLEDYVLRVTLTSGLACPRTVRFKIFLIANGAFPGTFAESVRGLFVSLAGISGARVTVVSPLAKRSVEQATNSLEIELQVTPDETQTEPTPEKAVQDFVEQQLTNFNNQLTGLPNAPPDVTTKDVDGVPLETEILGEKPVPPTTPPTAVPVAVDSPTSAPPSKVSSSSIVTPVFMFLVSSILAAF